MRSEGLIIIIILNEDTRSAMDLVVSRSSIGKEGGSLNMGELEALGAPHPF